MRKLCVFIRIVMGTVFGVFLGSSLFRWIHYRSYPGLYAMQSTPWYWSILVNAIFTGIVLVTLSILLYLVTKKRK